MSAELRVADLMIRIGTLEQKLANRQELITDVFERLDRGEKSEEVVEFMLRRMKVFKEVEG